LETEQSEVAWHTDALETPEGTTELINTPALNYINMVENDTSSRPTEHAEDTMEVEVNAHGTRLAREGFTSGVVPLMEYVHTELISDIVRVGFFILLQLLMYSPADRSTSLSWAEIRKCVG
jgi:hypothetical protein